eukprot:ANDGO_03353.mRNA.1 Differentially expressed in FDCP 8 homolog
MQSEPQIAVRRKARRRVEVAEADSVWESAAKHSTNFATSADSNGSTSLSISANGSSMCCSEDDGGGGEKQIDLSLILQQLSVSSSSIGSLGSLGSASTKESSLQNKLDDSRQDHSSRSVLLERPDVLLLSNQTVPATHTVNDSGWKDSSDVKTVVDAGLLGGDSNRKPTEPEPGQGGEGGGTNQKSVADVATNTAAVCTRPLSSQTLIWPTHNAQVEARPETAFQNVQTSPRLLTLDPLLLGPAGVAGANSRPQSELPSRTCSAESLVLEEEPSLQPVKLQGDFSKLENLVRKLLAAVLAEPSASSGGPSRTPLHSHSYHSHTHSSPGSFSRKRSGSSGNLSQLPPLVPSSNAVTAPSHSSNVASSTAAIASNNNNVPNSTSNSSAGGPGATAVGSKSFEGFASMTRPGSFTNLSLSGDKESIDLLLSLSTQMSVLSSYISSSLSVLVPKSDFTTDVGRSLRRISLSQDPSASASYLPMTPSSMNSVVHMFPHNMGISHHGYSSSVQHNISSGTAAEAMTTAQLLGGPPASTGPDASFLSSSSHSSSSVSSTDEVMASLHMDSEQAATEKYPSDSGSASSPATVRSQNSSVVSSNYSKSSFSSGSGAGSDSGSGSRHPSGSSSTQYGTSFAELHNAATPASVLHDSNSKSSLRRGSSVAVVVDASGSEDGRPLEDPSKGLGSEGGAGGSVLELPDHTHISLPGNQFLLANGTALRLELDPITERPSRPSALAKQNNTCPGCGCSIGDGRIFSSKARMCEYTNLLFCRKCHLNSKSIIPWKVLHQWSVEECFVSEIALHFLESVWSHPIICVSAINPLLFERESVMREVRRLRLRLCEICEKYPESLTKSVMDALLGNRVYMTHDTELFSLSDLESIHKNPTIVLQELRDAYTLSKTRLEST